MPHPIYSPPGGIDQGPLRGMCVGEKQWTVVCLATHTAVGWGLVLLVRTNVTLHPGEPMDAGVRQPITTRMARAHLRTIYRYAQFFLRQSVRHLLGISPTQSTAFSAGKNCIVFMHGEHMVVPQTLPGAASARRIAHALRCTRTYWHCPTPPRSPY